MKLYIGGYAQGKTEYALEAEGVCSIVDGMPSDNDFSNDKVLWNHFNLAIRDMVYDGKTEADIEAFVCKILDEHMNIAVITDEVGCGIVPIDETERKYRDIVGHMQIMLAKRAESVIRIVCGIGTVIK